MLVSQRCLDLFMRVSVSVGLVWSTFFFSRRRTDSRSLGDWRSDVCSSGPLGFSSIIHICPVFSSTKSSRLKIELSNSRDLDRKSVGKGKREDLGGRRCIKKKKKKLEKVYIQLNVNSIECAFTSYEY